LASVSGPGAVNALGRVEMRKSWLTNRRTFIKSAAAASAWPLMATLMPAQSAAQSLNGEDISIEVWRQLADLTRQAIELGIPVPRMSAYIDFNNGRDYQQVMPAAVELIESLETASPLRPVPMGKREQLVKQADNLLRRIHQAERNLPDERDVGLAAAPQPGRPSFDSLKDGYRHLFETSEVRPQHRSTVEWYLKSLLTERSQRRWYTVAQAACCPWYFVAITHAMEAAFSFQSHLHNGDSLHARTRHIPRGRPKTGSPPFRWEDSAVDALDYDGFVDAEDWTLERTLYRWESYNGFRSRQNGINTPYLWSFSNHYSRGKFVADNVWDPTAISKQCGAAVMLKELVRRKLVRIPT
jgi:lysozyme family protein